MSKWEGKYSIQTGKSFYPENGLLIKKAGYTSYHLGECCVRAVDSSRNYIFCPTCSLSQQVAMQMINKGVNFLNAKIVAVDGVKVKNAESFGAEMDGEKLMVSSSNFDDGSMIVSVGTTDFDNHGR